MVDCPHPDVGSDRVATTISVGATLRLPDSTPQACVHCADRLMCRSKDSLMNRLTTVWR